MLSLSHTPPTCGWGQLKALGNGLQLPEQAIHAGRGREASASLWAPSSKIPPLMSYVELTALRRPAAFSFLPPVAFAFQRYAKLPSAGLGV